MLKISHFTKHLLFSKIRAREIREKFVYKHLKISLLFKEFTNLPANKSRILRAKNAKFSGYCFYINTNIEGYFQICISVPSI